MRPDLPAPTAFADARRRPRDRRRRRLQAQTYAPPCTAAFLGNEPLALNGSRHLLTCKRVSA